MKWRSKTQGAWCANCRRNKVWMGNSCGSVFLPLVGLEPSLSVKITTQLGSLSFTYLKRKMCFTINSCFPPEEERWAMIASIHFSGWREEGWGEELNACDINNLLILYILYIIKFSKMNFLWWRVLCQRYKILYCRCVIFAT